MSRPDPIGLGTIDDNTIRKILEAGRWSPSGLNNQPWRFTVIRSGDSRKDSLAECTEYGNIVRDAPVLIVVLLHRASMYNAVKDHQAAGACIQNMLLASHALGLGAVWLGEILNKDKKTLEILGLSADDYELMAVIAAGLPAEKGKSERKPLDDLLL